MAQTKPVKMVKCAFGDTARITKCVGYCKLHKCYLTLKNVMNMNCLDKGCKHFVKFTNHKWWQNEIALAKQKRERKQKRKELIEKIYGTNKHI